jgi:hypothetical protein
MARKSITIKDFLSELQSYIEISDETMELASNSDINSKNNDDLSYLLNGWSRGDYDEDPLLLVQELKSLLK